MRLWLAALLLAMQVEYGHAAYYNDGVMAGVVQIRQAGWTAGDLPDPIPDGVLGFVARADCDEIGRRLWICHESEGCKGPYLVADCANSLRGHDERMQRRGIVVEIDWNTAARWGVIGRGPKDINVMVISSR